MEGISTTDIMGDDGAAGMSGTGNVHIASGQHSSAAGERQRLRKSMGREHRILSGTGYLARDRDFGGRVLEDIESNLGILENLPGNELCGDLCACICKSFSIDMDGAKVG